MASSDNAVHRVDVVLSINREVYSLKDGKTELLQGLINDVKQSFNTYCNNWVFQLECPCDSENYHFQCRLNLKDRTRTSQLSKYLEIEYTIDGVPSFYRISVSPTNKNPRTRFSYVMKDNTRVDGPWSDRPIYMGEDLINDLFPYQKFIYEDLTNPDNWDSRSIYNVYDPDGAHGKSSIVKRLAFDKPEEVGFISTCSSAAQLTSSIVKSGPKRLYIVDLPRVGMSWLEYNESGYGTRKYSPKWAEIVMVLETLKNGGPLVDTMYGKNEMLVMKHPNVVIFSNWPLESKKGDYFSKDRIRKITLSDENYTQISFLSEE